MLNIGYTPEKWLWTDADFEQMSWHDCKIHAMAFIADENNFTKEFVLDIDYILQWERNESGFEFWISPSTLVLKDVNLLKCINWEFRYFLDIRINGIKHSDGEGKRLWTIDNFYDSRIEVDAEGFTQYIRREPLLIGRQILTLQERGGLSFDRTHP